MKTRKNFGFGNFTQQEPQGEPSMPTAPQDAEAPERKKGKGEKVSLTVRLTREQWLRVHELARTEGTNFQDLAIQGLAKIFKEKGLKDF